MNNTTNVNVLEKLPRPDHVTDIVEPIGKFVYGQNGPDGSYANVVNGASNQLDLNKQMSLTESVYIYIKQLFD